jgi:preprotein translocase subunit YajC
VHHFCTVLWGSVMSDRDTWPFDLRRGDEVVLADGRVGVTVRIYCGDLWVVKLANGDEVKARRPELTWAGDTGERPEWFVPKPS